MKEQKAQVKTSFFKKIFIKICRIFGYEIIDQSNFYVPTQEKNLNENLNIQGKKSITLPLGEIKISRKVNALTIIFRSCTNIKASISTIKENESDPDFFSAIKICKRRKIGPSREESNRSLFYKKDISILARSGFSYEISKKILEIPKEEFKKFCKMI